MMQHELPHNRPNALIGIRQGMLVYDSADRILGAVAHIYWGSEYVKVDSGYLVLPQQVNYFTDEEIFLLVRKQELLRL